MVPGREVEDDSAGIAQEPKPPRTKRIEHRTISSTFPVRPVLRRLKSKSRADNRSIAIGEVDAATAYRFRACVAQGESHACWLWTGGVSAKGYGRFRWGDRLYSSHRMAYAIANGGVPQGDGYHGAVIMHACDNPPCCNPVHLTCGTHRDNVRDMAAKGRNYQPNGTARSRVVRGVAS